MGTIEVTHKDRQYKAIRLSKVGIAIGDDQTVYQMKTIKLLFKGE